MDVIVGLWRKLSSEELMLWTVVLEMTLESPLDCNEIHPVHLKGDEPWMFIGRTDVEAESTILWPSHAESWLMGKDPDAGRDWRQEKKETAEDEMAGWDHLLNAHVFDWTLAVGVGQGGRVCCDSWSLKQSDTTEWLNWTELNQIALQVINVTLNWKHLEKEEKADKFPQSE